MPKCVLVADWLQISLQQITVQLWKNDEVVHEVFIQGDKEPLKNQANKQKLK